VLVVLDEGATRLTHARLGIDVRQRVAHGLDRGGNGLAFAHDEGNVVLHRPRRIRRVELVKNLLLGAAELAFQALLADPMGNLDARP
jgi:hypothetical protein